MNEKELKDLVRRHKEMLASGKSIYFDAEDFDELAEYYELVDDIEQARELVSIGLQIHPNNDLLMLKKARFMIDDGEYDQALFFLDSSFKGYDLNLYLLKIESFLKKGQYQEAQMLVNTILENENDDLDFILSELGFLYVDADYFDEAIGFFEKSLALDNENMDVLTDLSYAYEMVNDFESSVRINNMVLDLDPYSYESWINIGKLYSLQSEYDKAIDAFEFALTIDDTHNDVYKLKAHCLLLCNREEEAIRIFEECSVRNPDDETLYYALSECYFSLEQYDKMLEQLDKYEELKGESALICAKKAAAYLQKGDADKALYFLEKGFHLDPVNDELNMMTGEFYFRSADFSKAEEYFLKAYQNNAENASLLDKLSIISIVKNEINKSVLYLEKLILIEPNKHLKTRLGLLYFELGDKKKFNDYIRLLTDEELRHIITFFYSEEQLDINNMARDSLINSLNEARECRVLFKNIIY